MMKQRSGRVLSVFFTPTIWGDPGHCCYTAAKMGIVGFTWMVSRELSPYGVTVNAFSPGAINSRLNAALAERLETSPDRGEPFSTHKGRGRSRSSSKQCRLRWARPLRTSLLHNRRS